ncbi:sulfurtransferase complex subunit TusD [Tatumella ptyseos]|uniref:sulfurtransferase complex subunit TusD n=1 Tax=Tatumella ptyseos TaxID=82987 RepID=UPI0026EB95C3|nr:sulfurtransferase complex subunit TusD [Tatumella ptyseos]WKX26666.1 sulfurtransferase complex subunit TusD [Tatumella ptyseos]
MRYALIITGPAYGTQNATSAWMFAKALLQAEHTIASVFFYQEAVSNANMLTSPANDEHNLIEEWVKLSREENIALNICVSAALRRGVVDQEHAQAGLYNFHPQFNFSGLGELAISLLTCERVIQF